MSFPTTFLTPMAQRSECGDEVRRRQRIQDDQDELGRFAHRLSLDVTNEALNFAAMNGVGQDITSSGTNDPSERGERKALMKLLLL